MAALQQLTVPLSPYRRHFFATSMVGLLVCVTLIFLTRSPLGFALAGPLVMLPWGLMCVGSSKHDLSSIFFVLFAVMGIAWPFIVLLD